MSGRPRRPLRARVRDALVLADGWMARRPAIDIAAGRARVVVVAKAVLRPRLARFRTRLTESGTGSGLLAGLRRVRGRVPRHGTPMGFPQDAGHPVVVVDALPDVASREFARLSRRARRASAVLVGDRVAAGGAEGIVRLAETGVPLVAPVLPPQLRATLGPALSNVLARDLYRPDDAHERERHSIAVRRAARADAAPVPTVSVLLASRRPADLPAAIRMVRAQRHCTLQLCVGLHGPDWPDDTESAVAAAFGGEVVVARFPDTVDLGTMLDALGRRADGDHVTKWDDDDHYGADHVADLVAALRYADAQIVGKAAEFVHLESLDTTIRRYAIGAESYSTTLAGGTLLLRTATLREVGGWPAAPRRVDGLLIDTILREGGSSYRTHGFQFVLRRRKPSAPLGHTWTAPDEYFLREAVDQRPGLDLPFADIAQTVPGDPPVEAVDQASGIAGNRWDRLGVAPPAAAGNERRISVCIPARDPGPALDRTLAGLRAQHHPRDRFEVVVVDDGSEPPLEVDAGDLSVTVHRRERGDGFGAAAARDAAAAIATGEVLVFLDADVIPSRDFVGAMARWFDVAEDAVVLGAVRFVDVDGLSADEVERLLLAGGWDDVARARGIPGQDWRAALHAETRGFTVDEVDLFRVVTGAALAVHRDRFREVGGFRDIPIRGVQDTELGYRLMTAGGVLVPDAAATVWHQGRPTLRGGAARRNRRERRPTAERLLPVGGFRGPRPPAGGDGPVVARAEVRVVGDPADPDVARAIARVRAVGAADVSVAASGTIAPDGRITDSFARIWCAPSYLWGPGTLLRVVDALSDPDVGRLRVPDVDGGVALEAYTTRSLCRSGRVDDGTPIGDRAARLFGERWIAAERLDLRPVAGAGPGPLRRRERWAQRLLARLRWIGRTGRRRAAAGAGEGIV